MRSRTQSMCCGAKPSKGQPLSFFVVIVLTLLMAAQHTALGVYNRHSVCKQRQNVLEWVFRETPRAGWLHFGRYSGTTPPPTHAG